MASQPPNNNNNNQPPLPDVGDRSTTAAFRCPAGSHIGTNMTAPKLNEVSKNFRSTDLSQTAVIKVGDSSRSTADHPATGSSSVQRSTQETERARIEARKHHKRITDAIYARRRRLREKEDEKQLVRETEQTQRDNKRLRQENNELQIMLDRAAVQIEARGDADRKWLQEVFAKPAATPASAAEVVTAVAAAADSNAERSHRPPPESASPKKKKRSHVPDRATPPEQAAVKSSSRTTEEEHGPPPRSDPPRSNHLRLEEEMEALRQASYLQGLQDAALLQQQQQQQPRSAAVRDSLWLTEQQLRNDPRTIEQLYLARRLQALGAFPTSTAATTTTTTTATEHSLSSILRPELTSFLEQRRALQRSSIVDSLFPRATTTADATSLAAATLERYRNQTAASRLGLTTTATLRSSLYPPPSRQWPLTQRTLDGLWNTNNAWDDRASSSGLSTSLFLPPARDPPLSLQLAAQLQLLASPPSSSTNSGLLGDTPPLPRLNFPPL